MVSDFHQKSDKFKRWIEKYHSILLLRHIYPDGDCVGAQHALYSFLKLNYPKKEINFIGSNISHYLSDLFPNENMKIKKVTKKYDLQILVDTSALSRVDGPLNNKSKLISLDHHKYENIKSDLDIRYKNRSSACEIIAKMLLYFRDEYNMKFTKEIAEYVYIGITTDTKRMWYNLTSDLFLIVSELIKYGINTKFINETIYYWEVNEIRFRNILIDKAVMTGTCIHVILESEDYSAYNLDYSTAKDLALHLVEIKKGLYFVIAVKNNKTNVYHVSLRSKEKRIDHLATKYGGGGHKLASGVRIKNREDVNKLITEMQEYSKE